MERIERLINSARDDHKIYTYKWEPEGNPKAIVQIVHGAGEYANRYEDFAKVLVARGFMVYAHDHRGHGNSVTNKKEFGFFGESEGEINLVEDTYEVTKLIKEENPGSKVFILGHSMGSFITRYFLILHSQEVDGALIVGTGNNSRQSLELGLKVANQYIKSGNGHKQNKFLDTLIFKTFNKAFLKEKDVNAWLSHDKASRKEFKEDPLCGITFTAYGFRDMFELVKFVTEPSNVEKVRKDLPIFMLSGDQDPVGGNGKMVVKAYELYKQQNIKDLHLKLYKGMRHEILNEVGKQEVYKDVIGWLNKHI